MQSRRGRVREKKASSPYRPRVYCFDSSQISNIISSLDKDTVDCKNFKGLNSSVGSIRRLVGNDSEVIYDLDKPDDIPSDILEALVCDNRAFCSHNHSLIAVVGNKVVVKNSARDSRPGLSDDQESNMSITSTVGIQNEEGENGDDASQKNPFEDESERQNQTNADSAEEIEVENEAGLDGERLLEPATSSEGSIPQVLPGPSTSVPKGDVTSELSSVSRLSAKLSMQGSKLELQQTSKEYIKITDSLPRKASTGPNSILTNQDSYDNFSRRDWPNTMSIDDVKDLSSDSTDSELFGDWKGSTVDYNCPYCAVTTPHDHSDRCEMYFNVDMSSLQSSSSLYHTPQVNDDNSDNDSDQWHYSFTEHSTYKISERAETGNYNLSNMCGQSSSVDLLAISPHGQQTNGHPENTTNELEQEVSLAEISRSLRFYGNVVSLAHPVSLVC